MLPTAVRLTKLVIANNLLYITCLTTYICCSLGFSADTRQRHTHVDRELLIAETRTCCCCASCMYLRDKTNVVRVPVLRVSAISVSCTSGTGRTRSFQAPMYAGDRQDSVFAPPQVPWGSAITQPYRLCDRIFLLSARG